MSVNSNDQTRIIFKFEDKSNDGSIIAFDGASTSGEDQFFVSRLIGVRGPLRVDDPSSEWYIHPNKHLVLVLTSSLLDGSNYHSWCVRCACLLYPRTSSALSMGRLKNLRGRSFTIMFG